jgi:hypothetical protein
MALWKVFRTKKIDLVISVKTIEKGETEVKETKETFSEEKQSAGFGHFLSKL